MEIFCVLRSIIFNKMENADLTKLKVHCYFRFPLDILMIPLMRSYCLDFFIIWKKTKGTLLYFLGVQKMNEVGHNKLVRN